MVRTGLLGQFREVDDAAMGMEAPKEDSEDAERAGSVGGSAENSNHHASRTE